MKSIKKIFAGLLMATAAFGFFSCGNTDEELTVDFDVKGDTERTVKMTASSTNSEGHRVFVIYTLDGSDPSAKMISEYDKVSFATAVLAAEKDNASEGDIQKLLTYIDCGTSDVIESGKSITVSTSTVVNARAFYIDNSKVNPVVRGPNAKKTITIDLTDEQKNSQDSDDPAKVEVKDSDSDGNKVGELTFKLAKTGNSFSIHYYDTSDNTFALNETTKHCYYQFQFSTTKTNGGKWYLYIRQLGNSNPIPAESGSKFVAQGTFTGSCFNKTAVTETNSLVLNYKDKNGNEKEFAKITSVSAGADSSFIFDITANSGKTNIQAAIDANDGK